MSVRRGVVVALLMVCGCSGVVAPPVEGGCEPARSPFLQADATLVTAAISYCEQGDQGVAVVRTTVDRDALASLRLLSAGYIDGRSVTLTMSDGAGHQLPVLPPETGDRWVEVPLTIPADWGSRTLVFELRDDSRDTFGWGGLAFARKQPPPEGFPLLGWLAAALAALGFAAVIVRPPPPGIERPALKVTIARALALGLATVFALCFRRPDQVRAPYIWVEEGLVSIPQYLQHGWSFIFEPVSGYLIVPSKLLMLGAMALSPQHYPLVGFWLSVAFTWLVLCAVAFSPVALRAPFACALFALVIPTDSEVFGTAHYAFWWGSILAAVPLFWRTDAKEHLALRTALATLGGLSSPLVVALAPAFGVRWLLRRTRADTLVLAAIGLTSVAQVWFVKRTGTHGTSIPHDLSVGILLEKFVDFFVYTPKAPSVTLTATVAVALIAVLTFVAVRSGKATWVFAALLFCFGVSVAISVARVSVTVMEPFGGGPRYFFYPYIFLSWILIELLAISPRWAQALIGLCLVGALRQFLLGSPRFHDDIDWGAQLAQCERATSTYAFPVHYTGDARIAWHVPLTAADCARLEGHR